jgi:hypothetical protein
MAEINNGGAGHLVIAGVHDGRCGMQAGDPPTVAFRWARTGKRPELALAAGVGATLDGVGYAIASIVRSPLSEGFYVAVLTPAVTNLPADSASA